MVKMLRSLSAMLSRSGWMEKAGITFGGKRDVYKALGYKQVLMPTDFRARFKRNGVANRVVKAYPLATWRGGFEVVEDNDPTTETPFEAAWDALARRLRVAQQFRKGDTLGRLGQFAILVIGAPGEDTSLPVPGKVTANQVEYLMPYSQLETTVFRWDLDPKSSRYGRPDLYTVTRQVALAPGLTQGTSSLSRQVHWTRVIHFAEGLLDDMVYGEPCLQPIWNDLDDLEKVRGGGSEAFWNRANGGMQFDLDPDLPLEDEDEDDPDSAVPKPSASASGMKKQLGEMEHGLRKNLLTRGVTVTRMGSDVADISKPVSCILGLISTATGIPQRVLSGSEQAKLAGSADRTNWDERVTDRRDEYATMLLEEFINRMIEWGALPKPTQYQVRWSVIRVMDDLQRAEIATEWAALNRPNGPLVVLPDEIRERILQLGPLDEAGNAADMQMMPSTKPAAPKSLAQRKWALCTLSEKKFYMDKWLRLAADGKDQPRWEATHRAADRFRTEAQDVRVARFRNRTRRLGSVETSGSPGEKGSRGRG